MRILLLVDCYLPSTKSSARLIHDLAVEWVRQGHEVRLVAPDPIISNGAQLSRESGIDVLRVASPDIKSAPKPLRALYEARLSARIWRAGRAFFESQPCDQIVYYSPTIFFGSLVRRLKRLWGAPSYLILRDIFPQWAVDAGLIRKGSLIWKYFRRVERLQYDVADRIGVQSHANLLYFDEQGWRERYPLEVLWHWSPREHAQLPTSSMRQQLGLEGKTVFFYGGNVGVAQDMDNLLRLAEALLDRPQAHFLIVGEGSEVGRLKELVAERELGNVSFHPALDQPSYLAALSEFDVGLISLDAGLKTQNFPGKMLGYMYFAMPTLASINPGNDLKDVLESHRSGLVSINGDDATLKRHAVQLLDDADLRRELGLNGRALLQSDYSAERAAKQILQALDQPSS